MVDTADKINALTSQDVALAALWQAYFHVSVSVLLRSFDSIRQVHMTGVLGVLAQGQALSARRAWLSSVTLTVTLTRGLDGVLSFTSQQMCVVHNIPFLPSAALNRKYASDLAFYSVSQTSCTSKRYCSTSDWPMHTSNACATLAVTLSSYCHSAEACRLYIL